MVLKEYIKNITQTYTKGDAREESYYKHLDNLLMQYAEKISKRISVTTLPKKTEAGNPDFRIWDGKTHIIGYIEAKDPSIENLDHIQTTEQLKRYCSTFPNVILTNFHEFRLIREGQLIDRVSIGRFFIAKQFHKTPPLENEENFFKLLEKFFSYSIPRVHTARSLAKELAKRTRFLRDEVIKIEMEEKKSDGHKSIWGFYEAFKKYLISSLEPTQFADLYSQTITYGLFAARTRSKDDFNRELAFQFIPKTIGILKDIFRFISLEDPPKSLQIIVDDISEILKVTNVKKILHQFFHEGKGKDPIIHFYETFLSEYDPEIRERRGVYYTPEPVVQYIVRSLHQILKTDFNLTDGFAAKNVTVLDPAAGTLTFPAEAIKIAVEEFSKYGKAGLNKFVDKHILKNFYAFELMMAPYAIGHLKMGFLFDELGYDIGDERFKLYLTNSLEMEELEEIHIPGLSSLSEESHLAIEVKRDKPVLVIMGNPPYSGISSNINDWTEQLLKTDIDGAQSYYKVDDKPLGEKKLWLQDDYVKFLRFAQWKIQKAGSGVIGMITNHSYLDNPTFRGMRQSLMKTFNKIYILNLHGNSLKKETAPDGSKDENVFDIRQGVAIALFIKSAQRKENEGEVYYKDLYGLRDMKYEWLQNNDLNSTEHEKISPQTPYYFFIKRDTDNIQNYLQWPKITEIMPENNVGIVTARDKFVIDFNINSLKNRINQFCNSGMPDELIKQSYKLKDTSTFKLSMSRKKVAELDNTESYYKKILYRPFDVRNIFYSKWIVERPLKKIMYHMLAGDNLGLVSTRFQFNKEIQWASSFITKDILDINFLQSPGTAQIFPLYLYTNNEFGDLFDQIETARKPNIAPKIFEMLKEAFGQVPTPEEILYYIYGVFYSNIYREKYAELLKIDFPRVPFTREYELFKELGKLGKRLTDLHLLKNDELSKPVAKYEGSGDNDRIEKYEYNENRVYINSDNYFEGILEEIWNYHIGGYKVLRKYLRDRKGRQMDDPRHYCQIATAIAKTIEIQKLIDEVYLKVEETE